MGTFANNEDQDEMHNFIRVYTFCTGKNIFRPNNAILFIKSLPDTTRYVQWTIQHLVYQTRSILRTNWASTPGGGGTPIFSSYVGSGPASTVHPQNYQEFQAPPKNI